MIMYGESPMRAMMDTYWAYQTIAGLMANQNAAHNEYDQRAAASHAVMMLGPDALAAFCGLLVDRLKISIPEEWQ